MENGTDNDWSPRLWVVSTPIYLFSSSHSAKRLQRKSSPMGLINEDHELEMVGPTPVATAFIDPHQQKENPNQAAAVIRSRSRKAHRPSSRSTAAATPPCSRNPSAKSAFTAISAAEEALPRHNTRQTPSPHQYSQPQDCLSEADRRARRLRRSSFRAKHNAKAPPKGAL
uniref:Uncharacterized protein n=1 Tax=Sphaerodactylus townsendi TaxID=933632 RepID=A0ACB8FG84_9SAUR